MGIIIPSWVIVIVLILVMMYICKPCRKAAETFLMPAGLAPRQADLVEVAMRNNLYRGN